MAKRTDIKSILIIGAGPIVIGQACEFDYSGAQACKALKEEGYRVDPGQLESGHDHDRPGHGRRGVHRADQLADGRADHRQGAPRRGAADDGRPDRPQLRARPGRQRRAGEVRRRADRRLARCDPHGRGPRTVPRRDGRDRPRMPEGRAVAQTYEQAVEIQAKVGFPDHHPAELHAGRLRRRHRLQRRRVRGDRQARPRALAGARGADRGVGARLEGVRDGSGPRQRGQLHHRLLDREPRSDGRAHRRLDHGGAGADPDRQGIPAPARRLDRGAAQDRRRYRRLQRAVRHQCRERPRGRDRDEPARVAFVGAGVEGDRFPDRQDRGQAGGGLHAGRAEERHHRRPDPGVVRADHRLRRHQDSALRVREVPVRRRAPDHADEVGRRGHGDRPHLPGIAAEGACAGWKSARPASIRPGWTSAPTMAWPRSSASCASRVRIACSIWPMHSAPACRWKRCMGSVASIRGSSPRSRTSC